MSAPCRPAVERAAVKTIIGIAFEIGIVIARPWTGDNLQEIYPQGQDFYPLRYSPAMLVGDDGEGLTPMRQADRNRTDVRTAKTLITPALFSQPPPRPPGEEGEQPRTTAFVGLPAPLSPGGRGGGWERGAGGVRVSKRRIGVRLPGRPASSDHPSNVHVLTCHVPPSIATAPR